MEKVYPKNEKKSKDSKKETGELKNATEIANEGGPKKSANEYAKRIQEERANLMKTEAETQQDDARKIAEIGKSMGVDLSKSIAEKQKRADEIKKEIDAQSETEIKTKKPDSIIKLKQKKPEKISIDQEIGEFQGPASPAERTRVQKEALSDFVKGLKGMGKDSVEIGKKKKIDEMIPEAKRIDRIMKGDMRSDSAVKIDEIMEKSMESMDVKKRFTRANSMDELIHALDGVEIISNNDGSTHKVLDQQAYINNLFKTKNTKFLEFITQTEDIRKNVKRVFDAENIKKGNKKRMAA